MMIDRLTFRRWGGVVGMALGLGFVAGGCSSPTQTGSSAPPAKQSADLVQAGLKAQAKGQASTALTDYEAASIKDPTNKYAYYDMGVIYQQRGDGGDAQSAYHRALLADPNYKPALFNLAILLTTADPSQAVTLYRQLLQNNPDDPNVNFNLGLLLISQNQAAEGHTDLQKALRLNPTLRSRVPPGVTP